jgi:hypothetical protein
MKAIKLGDNELFTLLYININYTFNHQQLTIQTNNHFCPKQFDNPNVLKNSIERPFKLFRFLVMTTTKLYENINFFPNTNNVRGKNCKCGYKHQHIKDFKVLMHYDNQTMPL